MCVPLGMTVCFGQFHELQVLPSTSPPSKVIFGVSTGVSTFELFKLLLRSFGNGRAAVGEAEVWHLSVTSGTGKGGVESQEGRQVNLECYSPAPQGASRSELCLYPGVKKKRPLGWGVAHLPTSQMREA